MRSQAVVFLLVLHPRISETSEVLQICHIDWPYSYLPSNSNLSETLFMTYVMRKYIFLPNKGLAWPSDWSDRTFPIACSAPIWISLFWEHVSLSYQDLVLRYQGSSSTGGPIFVGRGITWVPKIQLVHFKLHWQNYIKIVSRLAS